MFSLAFQPHPHPLSIEMERGASSSLLPSGEGLGMRDGMLRVFAFNRGSGARYGRRMHRGSQRSRFRRSSCRMHESGDHGFRQEKAISTQRRRVRKESQSPNAKIKLTNPMNIVSRCFPLRSSACFASLRLIAVFGFKISDATARCFVCRID